MVLRLRSLVANTAPQLSPKHPPADAGGSPGSLVELFDPVLDDRADSFGNLPHGADLAARIEPRFGSGLRLDEDGVDLLQRDFQHECVEFQYGLGNRMRVADDPAFRLLDEEHAREA